MTLFKEQASFKEKNSLLLCCEEVSLMKFGSPGGPIFKGGTYVFGGGPKRGGPKFSGGDLFLGFRGGPKKNTYAFYPGMSVA